MAQDVKVPVLPESVVQATIARWHKKVGDYVEQDELLVDIETDKVVLEVTAPQSGVIASITHAEGAQVGAQDVIGTMKEGSAPAAEKPAQESKPDSAAKPAKKDSGPKTSPAVRKMLSELGLDAVTVQQATGKDRLTPEDIHAFVASQKGREKTDNKEAKKPAPQKEPQVPAAGRQETREAIAPIRQRIAQRLVEAQQTAAMLTTFNEVDMSAIMQMRQTHKDSFMAKHDVKLGFMSFFMKAVCESLIKFPLVNASIDGGEVVYRNYCDLGVAVASERGLVVPVIRDAQTLTLAELEKNLGALAAKARNAQLTLEEMSGGTFTITNGGVFGSLLSTPILNPPQTAILGMHKIQERPVAIDGEVVIRPMMYLALSYDHRLIDGAGAVSFLVAVKTLLEEPERFILDLA